MSITNHGRETRSLDLTSYAEVVLAPAEADLAHPAFSNLFIETSALPERDALICARRPRSGGDRTYLFHLLSGRGRVGPATQFETESRALRRARPHARAIRSRWPATDPLSNTTGPVLDPIVALRQFVRLPPGGTARVAFITGFAESEEDAHRLVEKYHDRRAVARALALAGTHSQIELRHFGLTDRRHDPVPAPGWPAALRRSRACAPATPCRRTAAASPSCGSTASPATLPMLVAAFHRRQPSSRSSAICSRRTSTCAPRD